MGTSESNSVAAIVVAIAAFIGLAAVAGMAVFS
jgi:hypothetical protein